MRRTTTLILIFLLLLGMLPPKAYGAGSAFDVQIYVPGYGNNQYDFDENGNLEDSTENITLPQDFSGNLDVQVTLQTGYEPDIGNETATFNGTDLDYMGGYYMGSLDYDAGDYIDGIVGIAANQASFTIPALALEEPWINGVTVNGSNLNDYSNGNEYAYEIKINQAAGNQIVIDAQAGVTYVSHNIDDGNWTQGGDWQNWSLDFTEGSIGFASISFDIEGASGQAGTLEISIFYGPPVYASVNGNLTLFSVGFDGGAFLDAAVTVPNRSGEHLTIIGGNTWTMLSYSEVAVGDPGLFMGSTWHNWTVEMGSESDIYHSINLEDNGTQIVLRMHITHDPVRSSSGGGGSSSSEPEERQPNVINETNEPNISSDTILTPWETSESDGLSVTNITGIEAAALIGLAEAHVGDVPQGENEAIINIVDTTTEGNETYEVNLQGSDVNAIVGSSIDLLGVNTSAGQLRIRNEALAGLNMGSGSTLQVRLSKLTYDGRPGIDAELLIGEKVVSLVDGVYTLEIRVPYILQAGEDPAALCIEYIKDDGTTELVTESRYDVQEQMLSFFPPHLSKYGAAYRPSLFSDIPSSHWAGSYVTFLAARKVVTNQPGSKFRPDDAITRAEFINMAARAFSVANLSSRTRVPFKDVPPDQWYALAVGWSYINNISSFLVTGNTFSPDSALNKEEMTNLLNNVSLSLQLRLRTITPSVKYKDADSISPYALGAVGRMSTSGIVSEGGGGSFFPQSECTRAQAAQAISLLMSKMR